MRNLGLSYSHSIFRLWAYKLDNFANLKTSYLRQLMFALKNEIRHQLCPLRLSSWRVVYSLEEKKVT